MSSKKKLFIKIDESVRSEVKFGNNTILSVFGKETIPISLKNRSTIFISDVFYVLKLYHNLLSMDQLSKKKCDIHIRNGTCTVFDKNIEMIISVSIILNGLFSLNLSAVNFSYLNTVINDSNWLYHMPFGHLNFDR